MDRELYELLNELGRAGYLIQSYQEDRHGPYVITGLLRTTGCADVVILRDESIAAAWRTPIGNGCDELDPTSVHWQIADSPARVLKALLNLPAPGTPTAPVGLMDILPGIGLPASTRVQPIRMRRRGT